MVTSDFRPEVEIRQFRMCIEKMTVSVIMDSAIGAGRYHVPQRIFVVYLKNDALVVRAHI